MTYLNLIFLLSFTFCLLIFAGTEEEEEWWKTIIIVTMAKVNIKMVAMDTSVIILHVHVHVCFISCGNMTKEKQQVLMAC